MSAAVMIDRRKQRMHTDPATRRIVTLIQQIPSGCVATYGQIAALAGKPRNARQVGTVLRMLPDDVDVPWHRVVNGQGRISSRDNPATEGLQQFLLRQEGVEISDSGRIKLTEFQWQRRA